MLRKKPHLDKGQGKKCIGRSEEGDKRNVEEN